MQIELVRNKLNMKVDDGKICFYIMHPFRLKIVSLIIILKFGQYCKFKLPYQEAGSYQVENRCYYSASLFFLWYLMRDQINRSYFFESFSELCEAVMGWLDRLLFLRFQSLMGIYEPQQLNLENCEMYI